MTSATMSSSNCANKIDRTNSMHRHAQPAVMAAIGHLGCNASMAATADGVRNEAGASDTEPDSDTGSNEGDRHNHHPATCDADNENRAGDCNVGAGCGEQNVESQSISDDSRSEEDEDEDDGDDYGDDDDDDDDESDDLDDEVASFDGDSDEVPVWVRGERRWISGLTGDTTCGQLVEALLRDDGILPDRSPAASIAPLLAQYVISEKWRSVEQILAADTKVLNIWTAWGEAQSQVRLLLRKIELPVTSRSSQHPPPPLTVAGQRESSIMPSMSEPVVSSSSSMLMTNTTTTADAASPEIDSGRGSPAQSATPQDSPSAQRQRQPVSKGGHSSSSGGSCGGPVSRNPTNCNKNIDGSAPMSRHRNGSSREHINRRHCGNSTSAGATITSAGCHSPRRPSRNHRTHRSGVAGVESEIAVHPKTQRPSIEKLMKLILEQGETIQQQLIKLRDREHQIRRIEEARQRREKEHGRNYVLKAYLSSLNATGNDVAVDVVDSFDADADGNCGLNSDSGVHEGGSSPDVGANPATKSKTTKNFATKPIVFPLGKHRPKSKREYELFRHHEQNKEQMSLASAIELSTGRATNAKSALDEHIVWMERIVGINRQLQREEELIVRLNAKLTKYQADDPSMSVQQLNEAIGTVNSSLERSTAEAQRMQQEIDITRAMLGTKEEMIAQLSLELHQLEVGADVAAQMSQKQVRTHPPQQQTTIPMMPMMLARHSMQMPPPMMRMAPKIVPGGCTGSDLGTLPTDASAGLRQLAEGGLTTAFMQMGTLV